MLNQYFLITTFIPIVVLVILCILKYEEKHFFIKTISEIKKYNFLIRQLVSRDFKTKYKRSILGVFWSFLNPLLHTLVLYTVFSHLFRFDIPSYPIYLLCGIILFNFFSESTVMNLGSITENANLITKVYVPQYIYPLTRTLSSLINMLVSMMPLFIIVFFSKTPLSNAYFLLPIPIILLSIFSFGIGLILASSMVFFRDTQFIWGVISMIWMYLTPLFYPISILPPNLIWVINCNPLYYYITIFRSLIIEGTSPEPIFYLYGISYSLVAGFLGLLIFNKTKDNFILYI